MRTEKLQQADGGATDDEVTGGGAADDPAAVRWLDIDQQWAWRRFLEGTSRFLEALGDAHDDGIAVSLGEYHLLVQLSEAPDRTLRMSALADFLALSRSRLTHTVARMEKRGLVTRRPAPDDRRGVLCALTDDGWAVLVASAPAHVTAVRRLMVDVLDADELTTLGRAMAKLAHAAKEQAERPAEQQAE